MAINSAYAAMNSLYKALTGQQTTATPVDTFGSISSIYNNAGKDKILGALSAVIQQTIFPEKPYNNPWGSIRLSDSRYGEIIRKVRFEAEATPFSDDKKFSTNDKADGQTIDQYQRKNSKPMEFLIYKDHEYTDWLSIDDDVFNTAFSSADGVESFIRAQILHFQNTLEAGRSAWDINVLSNYAAAKINYQNADGNTQTHAVNLLTWYNGITGQNYTKGDLHVGNVRTAFAEASKSRIREDMLKMGVYTTDYHNNLASHTFAERTTDFRMVMPAKWAYLYEETVPVNQHHPTQMLEKVVVPFLQAADTPDKVNVNAIYQAANGAEATTDTPVVRDGIVAILSDTNAYGTYIHGDKVKATPYNARGDYYNLWAHALIRPAFDYQANGIVYYIA